LRQLAGLRLVSVRGGASAVVAGFLHDQQQRKHGQEEQGHHVEGLVEGEHGGLLLDRAEQRREGLAGGGGGIRAVGQHGGARAL